MYARIIPKRTYYMNAKIHIQEVLKQFLKNDVPRLYPRNKAKDMVLHQDLASSLTAKQTIMFLKDNNVKYITPAEWMLTSPDAATMDFLIWVILTRHLQKRNINTLTRLKRLSDRGILGY